MLFALTGAEERLLVCLSGGSNLTNTAEALRISIHTARSQLKAIQRKTGWRTQGELVRMVQQLGVINPQSSAAP
jgi:DNA-binding CsgD family transcriptional regulator